MPRLRQNIITGEWVVIAPGRAKRPEDFIIEKPRRSERKGPCPFCKGGDGYVTALPEDKTENVYTTPNKFPAFVVSPKDAPRLFDQDPGIYTSLPALGGHEVIVISDHMRDVSHLTNKEIRDLIWLYKQRYLHYEKDKNVNYTMIIHNHGPEAGASIHHPHSQLFASGVIPNYIVREIQGAENYYQKKKICVFCDIIEQERKHKVRIIADNQDFLAFTFFAARFPFEAWILPKKHQAYFENISEEEMHSLAKILKDILIKLDIKLNDPPLNYFIHTSPHKSCEDPVFDHIKGEKFYHWHIEVAPRVSKFGGFELGSGMIIDVVSPEKAAEFLKKM
jgi:UDPglucose--hexose-1-phosphate uridylyltransferase